MKENIQVYENILNDSNKILEALNAILDKFEANQDNYQNLKAFYGSEAYFEAVETSNHTHEYDSIACGVLSEDAIFNLIGDYYSTSIRMLELATQELKNH